VFDLTCARNVNAEASMHGQNALQQESKTQLDGKPIGTVISIK
jgi:hypothetical protein